LLGGIGKVLGTGALLGFACAFGMVQVERGMMGPMVSLDPLVVGASAIVLALCGGIAVYLPSRRATRQHPAEVLRSSL
jgi:ABC-type antimicrobial peptide transport system permease subunit